MKRKHSPQHDFWHRRVEGQIKDVMKKHPEWFNPKSDRDVIINSLAKRIVGEIVAACEVRHNTGSHDAVNCKKPVREEDETRMSSSGGGMDDSCTPASETLKKEY